jgi:hypothetical protein
MLALNTQLVAQNDRAIKQNSTRNKLLRMLTANRFDEERDQPNALVSKY